jgi:hypothetical protein
LLFAAKSTIRPMSRFTWQSSSLRLARFRGFAQPIEDKMLVARAAPQSQIMLLGEVDSRPHLDREIIPCEGFIKLLPIQRAGAPP